MDIKLLLSEIIHERMKTKSELDKLRFLTEAKGSRYDSIINILLDKTENIANTTVKINRTLVEYLIILFVILKTLQINISKLG